MPVNKRRYRKQEFAQRGDALVEKLVRPRLSAADDDKFVAIDIETGEYELDRNEMKAVDRLRKRVADPQIWLVHVTLGYLHRFGLHRLAHSASISDCHPQASMADVRARHPGGWKRERFRRL